MAIESECTSGSRYGQFLVYSCSGVAFLGVCSALLVEAVQRYRRNTITIALVEVIRLPPVPQPSQPICFPHDAENSRSTNERMPEGGKTESRLIHSTSEEGQLTIGTASMNHCTCAVAPVEGYILVGTKLMRSYRFALKVIASQVHLSTQMARPTSGLGGEKSSVGNSLTSTPGAGGQSAACDTGFQTARGRRVLKAESFQDEGLPLLNRERENAAHPFQASPFFGFSDCERGINTTNSYDFSATPSFGALMARDALDIPASVNAVASMSPVVSTVLGVNGRGRGTATPYFAPSSGADFHSSSRKDSSSMAQKKKKIRGPSLMLKNIHHMVDATQVERQHQFCFTPACVADTRLVTYRTAARYVDDPLEYVTVPSTYTGLLSALENPTLSSFAARESPMRVIPICHVRHVSSSSSIPAISLGVREGATSDGLSVSARRFSSSTGEEDLSMTQNGGFHLNNSITVAGGHVFHRSLLPSRVRLLAMSPGSPQYHPRGRKIDFYVHIMDILFSVKLFIRLPHRHSRLVRWDAEGVGQLKQPISGKSHLLMWEANYIDHDTVQQVMAHRKHLRDIQMQKLTQEEKRNNFRCSGADPVASTGSAIAPSTAGQTHATDDPKKPIEKCENMTEMGDELLVLHFSLVYEPLPPQAFTACPSDSDASPDEDEEDDSEGDEFLFLDQREEEEDREATPSNAGEVPIRQSFKSLFKAPSFGSITSTVVARSPPFFSKLFKRTNSSYASQNPPRGGRGTNDVVSSATPHGTSQCSDELHAEKGETLHLSASRSVLLPSLQFTYRVSGLASGLAIKRLQVLSDRPNWEPKTFFDRYFLVPLFPGMLKRPLVKLENKTTWVIQPVSFSDDVC